MPCVVAWTICPVSCMRTTLLFFWMPKSIHEMERKENADLNKMHSWLWSNKLSLNASKSSYMIFTNRIIPNDIIKIDNTALNSYASPKFLGIYIENKLNFVQYLNNISCKITKSLRVMWKLSVFLPKYVLKKFIFSLWSLGSYSIFENF